MWNLVIVPDRTFDRADEAVKRFVEGGHNARDLANRRMLGCRKFLGLRSGALLVGPVEFHLGLVMLHYATPTEREQAHRALGARTGSVEMEKDPIIRRYVEMIRPEVIAAGQVDRPFEGFDPVRSWSSGTFLERGTPQSLREEIRSTLLAVLQDLPTI